MNRTVQRNLLALTVVLTVKTAGTASAQEPDVRNIRPQLMLLVDSSGSMERLPNCVCSTDSCAECLPSCGAAEMNRWSVLLEAFTGTFDTFSCVTRDRSIYPGEYDYNYFIPHHEPPVAATTQQPNGVLDVYVDRIRFGLMTFDGVSTLTTRDPLVPATDWTAVFLGASDNNSGMYSYGGQHTFTFPGCLTTYAIDNGARGTAGGTALGGPLAPDVPGNLVSFGAETDDHIAINGNIQASLLGVRPFGPTPIAGMLDDFRTYLATSPDVIPKTAPASPGDPYAACRPHFGVVVTDGYPNADMRGAPYYCDSPGFTCPYDRPEEIAADLCTYDAVAGECTGDLDGLFVVGFNVADATSVALLNTVAAAGGTTSAYFADDRDSLVAALSAAFDRAAPGTTTRTVPAFGGTASAVGNVQYQFNTGFSTGGASGMNPWYGILERKRFTCLGTAVVEEPLDATAGDYFHEELNARATARNLYTALPSDSAEVGDWLTGDVSGDLTGSLYPPTTLGTPTETGIATSALETSNAALLPAFMNAADLAERNAILDWVHARGSAPAGRIANRLGDIYHSSPAVVSAPLVDRADEDFNAFRLTNVVSSRPTVVYVGTNDGILHAFAAEDHTVVCTGTGPCPHDTDVIDAGTELWGFVPPMLLPKLQDASVSHQWMIDGSPIVRDMYYARAPGSVVSADTYHSVLLVTLRGGGGGVFALDVTDPLAPPKFLWQLSGQGLGPTLGQPAVAQVTHTLTGVQHTRAVAIIPGGSNTTGALGGSCPAGAMPDEALPDDIGGVTPRPKRRCYTSEGRVLLVVDLATGLILRKWDDSLLTAPMTGGVSVFTGETGTVATRAFMTDADGVIWRLDLTGADASSWTLEAFHDIFHGLGADAGEPAYNPPILSTLGNGSIVIIQGTGNVDLLDGTAANRVVSLTENVSFAGDGSISGHSGTLNWQIQLAASEQVTGPLELFDSNVYFGTFRAFTDPVDACAFGESRLWGVHYANNAGGVNPANGLESTPGGGIDTTNVGPFANQLIMGVAVTQRPSCFVTDVVIDPYLGNRSRVIDQGGPQFQLVAQVGGSGALTPGASIAEITRDLPAPVSYTSVEAFAGSLE